MKAGQSSPILGVLFDMDGVLIEAKEWHYDALNRALRLFGHEISRHEHLTTFDGLPTRKKLEMLTMERQLPRSLHGFINELKQDFTMEFVNAHCKPLFIHEYALARLKAEGYKLGVASNAVRNTVDVMMQKASLAQYLDTTVSNEDVKLAKPDPEMYVKGMANLGLKPEQTLVVEDNENGIKAARASGAHVFVVQEVTDVTYANIQSHIMAAAKGRVME